MVYDSNDPSAASASVAGVADRRILVRPSSHSPHSLVTVVARMPLDVERSLSSSLSYWSPSTSTNNPSTTTTPGASGPRPPTPLVGSGRIDYRSGLAVLCLNRDDDDEYDIEHDDSDSSYNTNVFAKIGGIIKVWEYAGRTLSEDLSPPPGYASKFVHPEYLPLDYTNDGGRLTGTDSPPPPLTESLVAFTPFGGGGGGGGVVTGLSPRGGGSTAGGYVLPYHSLYACSPDGVLCMWNDALAYRPEEEDVDLEGEGREGSRGRSTAMLSPPDACVALPLKRDEIATCVVSGAMPGVGVIGGGRGGEATVGVGHAGGVYVGTSRGRVWMVQCRSRPLELRGRVIVSYDAADGCLTLPAVPFRGRGSSVEEGIGGGAAAAASALVSTALTTTPGKRLSDMFYKFKETVIPGASLFDDEEDDNFDPETGRALAVNVDDAGTAAGVGEGGGVFAIVPLPCPPAASLNASVDTMTHSTNTGFKKRPRKDRILGQSILVLSNDLVLHKFKTTSSSSTGDATTTTTPGGGRTHPQQQQPRTVLDDQIEIAPHVKKFLLERFGDRRLGCDKGEACVAMVPMKCSLSRDGAAVVVALRASTVLQTTEEGPGGEEHSLYMVRCVWSCRDLREGREGKRYKLTVSGVQWLSRYPSAMVPRLECAGLVAVEVMGGSGAEEDEGGGHVAYSAWQIKTGAEGEAVAESGAVATGVSMTAVDFPPFGFYAVEEGGGEADLIDDSDGAAKDGSGCRPYDVDLPVRRILGAGISHASEGGLFLSQGPSVVLGVRVKVERPLASQTTTHAVIARAHLPPGKAISPLSDVYDRDREVLTLVEHLMALYHRHDQIITSAVQKQRRGGKMVGPTGAAAVPLLLPTDASVAASQPPSLLEASRERLNAAVARSSLLLCDEPIATGSEGRVMMTAGDALREKMRLHKSFVNFLSHAGIYRKLSTARCILADHGEMTRASQSLVHLLDEYAAKASSNTTVAGNHAGQGGGGPVRLAPYLEDLQDECTTVAARLSSFQHAVVTALSSETLDSETTKNRLALVGEVSRAVSVAFGSALRYRTEQSDVLYDLPRRRCRENELTGGSAVTAGRGGGGKEVGGGFLLPWTTEGTVRDILLTQLRLIDDLKLIEDEDNRDGNLEHTKEHVETIASSLLESYLDEVHDAELVADGCPVDRYHDLLQSYDVAKSIAIPLMRTFLGDRSGLQASVRHEYFDGIVEICNDNAGTVSRRRSHSKKEALVSSSSSNSAVVVGSDALKELLNYETSPLRDSVNADGISFSTFVLNWLTDRGRYADVLDYGRHCPQDLASFLDNDPRMRMHHWINDVRDGRYDDARKWLASSSGAGAGADGTGTSTSGDAGGAAVTEQSLEDRRLFLSIGKLAAKLASPGDDNSNNIQARHDLDVIHNGLVLVRAQEMMGVGGDKAPAMSGAALMDLALQRVADDTIAPDDHIVAGLAGLSVAEVLSPTSSSSYSERADTNFSPAIQGSIEKEEEVREASSPVSTAASPASVVSAASSVWSRIIQAESHIWEEMHKSQSRCEISEYELKNRIAHTMFFGLTSDYNAQYKRKRKMKCHQGGTMEKPQWDLSFYSNAEVRRDVLKNIGWHSDNVVRLLDVAARLAVVGDDGLPGNDEAQKDEKQPYYHYHKQGGAIVKMEE